MPGVAISQAPSVQHLMCGGGRVGGEFCWASANWQKRETDRQRGGSSSSSTRGKAEESIRKLPSKQSVPEFLLSANPLERESLWTEKPTNALHSTQQQHRRSSLSLSLSRRSLQANRQTTWNTLVNATLCLLRVLWSSFCVFFYMVC